MIESALLVGLGWMLGLLGGPISERMRRGRRRKELVGALNAELGEFRHLMAALAYRLRSQIGEVDQELIEWMLPFEREREGTRVDEISVKALEKLAQLPPEQLAAGQTNRVARGQSLSLKTYSLPLFESAVREMTLLRPRPRQRMLAIREQIDLLNQEVPYLMGLHARTFDASLDVINREVIREITTSSYSFMARSAKNIADRISEVLEAG